MFGEDVGEKKPTTTTGGNSSTYLTYVARWGWYLLLLFSNIYKYNFHVST